MTKTKTKRARAPTVVQELRSLRAFVTLATKEVCRTNSLLALYTEQQAELLQLARAQWQ